MSDLGPEAGELVEVLASRLRVLGQLFTDLGNSKGAARLLESLLADDPAAFHKIIDRFDLPPFPLQGRCVWVRQVLDDVLLTPTVQERCTLRDDLTVAEQVAVIRIAT